MFIFYQSIVHVTCHNIVSWYKGEESSLQPYGYYGLLSLSYVGAMVCSNSALAYISYPTQVGRHVPIQNLLAHWFVYNVVTLFYLCSLLVSLPSNVTLHKTM